MTRADLLTAKLLDGTLGDDEWAELETILASDADALHSHMAILELEGVLRGERTGFDLSDRTLARVKAAQEQKTTQAVMAEIATHPAPWTTTQLSETKTKATRRGFAVIGGIAIAAAVLVGLWQVLAPRENEAGDGTQLTPQRQDFAKLTRSLGSVELLSPSGEVIPADEGSHVPPGHTLRTVGEESRAQVELPDRTMVDIEPDSVVRFIAMPQGSNDLPHVYLAAGQLTAAMPDRVPAQPLVVGTGVAEVFAKAGIFVVSSTGPESARVDVRKGKVEVVRPGSRARFPMDDGAAYFQAGLAKVITENSLRVDSTPSRTLQLPGQHDVAFAPDGEDVWIGSSRQFTLWTRDGGTANKLFGARKGFDRAVFARDRKTLVTLNTREGQVLVRDVPDGIARATFDLKLPEPRLWTVSRGAEWFAMTDPRPNHKRLHVIDGRTGKERYLREFEKAVGGMTASPDGKILAVGLSEGGRGLNNQVLLLDAISGERLAALPTQRKGLMSLIFSDDGRRLAVGFNGLVQVWDVKERELLRSITGFERVPTCLTFSPDSRVLAAGTQDGQVWVWSLATGQPIQRLEVAARGVRSMCFGKDGKRLVTMAVNSPVAIWEVAVPPAAPGEVQ